MGIQDDEWPQIAEAIRSFFSSCLESPNNLAGVCARFAASKESKGFQSGLLSPFLNALRPRQYAIVNSKTARTLGYLTGFEVARSIDQYPQANRVAVDFVDQHSEQLDIGERYGASAIQVFDMFSHWMVAIRKFHFGVLADPLAEFFASREEANAGLDLFKKAFDYLGVDDPDDPRVALTIPKGSRPLLRLNFGHWSIVALEARRRGRSRRAELALLADRAGTKCEPTKVYASDKGLPTVNTYSVSFDEAVNMGPDLEGLFQDSCLAIAHIYKDWKRSVDVGPQQQSVAEVVPPPRL